MSGEASESGTPANESGAGGVTATLFTQDQVNRFNAEAKRGALGSYFKELGFDAPPSPEELKAKLGEANEYVKLKDGQKGDIERLTDQLTAKTAEAEQVPSLKGQLLQAQIAADAGLKSKYWKYVEGSTAEEIEASVKSILEDIGVGTGDGPKGEPEPQEGAKRGLTPNPQQGAGSGRPPAKSMQSGAEAYKAKHKKE